MKSDVHFPPSDWFKPNRKTRRLQLQALFRFLPEAKAIMKQSIGAGEWNGRKAPNDEVFVSASTVSPKCQGNPVLENWTALKPPPNGSSKTWAASPTWRPPTRTQRSSESRTHGRRRPPRKVRSGPPTEAPSSTKSSNIGSSGRTARPSPPPRTNNSVRTSTRFGHGLWKTNRSRLPLSKPCSTTTPRLADGSTWHSSSGRPARQRTHLVVRHQDEELVGHLPRLDQKPYGRRRSPAASGLSVGRMVRHLPAEGANPRRPQLPAQRHRAAAPLPRPTCQRGPNEIKNLRMVTLNGASPRNRQGRSGMGQGHRSRRQRQREGPQVR